MVFTTFLSLQDKIFTFLKQSKILDLSYKMDLEFFICFRRVKPQLIAGFHNNT